MHVDLKSVRSAFPLLQKKIGKHPIVYLDSAATSQKPAVVLDAMSRFLREDNANVHRGVHPLSEASTLAYEEARSAVARFLHAKRHEIIFTKNATESINLVAHSYGETLNSGDVIAITVMEHHSNIVPWMQLATRKGLRIEWIGIDRNGIPDMESLKKVLTTTKVQLVALSGLSNVLGSMPDIAAICELSHSKGAKVLIDAAQLIAHCPVDVQKIGCDFLVFSGHKIYGPTGIGVLYGKLELLDQMSPFLGGGDMISSVTEKGFSSAELPRKFEAGTPPIAEAVGLRAALQWVQSIGIEAIDVYERSLLHHAYQKLSAIPGVQVFGPTDNAHRHSCIAFTLEDVHPHDLTQLLGAEGICLRAGHHCTQPLHRFLGINATARLSVAAYNTIEEIDRCMDAIPRAVSRIKG